MEDGGGGGGAGIGGANSVSLIDSLLLAIDIGSSGGNGGVRIER